MPNDAEIEEQFFDLTIKPYISPDDVELNGWQQFKAILDRMEDDDGGVIVAWVLSKHDQYFKPMKKVVD